ncbi:MAG: peptide-N4-asparagine amidase [Vulcanimicrobiaceae bacterium]
MHFVGLFLALWLPANGFATYQPATVDAPVARPHARHCTVTLYRNQGFAGFAPFLSAYEPPAGCRAPWSKVVLEFDTHVKGVQYDRVGDLWFGRHEIFRFSTAEPTRHGIAYHVEKDVTAYGPIFRSPQSVMTELGNVVNQTYTGVFYVTATLTFYEAAPGAPAARVADAILPVEDETGELPVDSSGHLTTMFATLPRNIVRATLDLYATNHGCDEFWYTNQPDGYARIHRHDELCGGGPYREIDISVDGKLANVVYPFPYIWTGGINPMLWRPLSAIHTLNVPSYAVDLDPFAGVFSDGKPHSISIAVYNDRGSWPIDGNLMLWTDAHASHTGGALTRDTIAAVVPESPAEHITKSGGTFHDSAARRWQLTGYVDTSSGRVWHSIRSSMAFKNEQRIDLASGLQDATQHTTFSTITTTKDRTGTHVTRVTTAYPLVADSIYPPRRKRRPYALVIDAEVHQALHQIGSNGRCDMSADGTALLKRLKPHIDAVARGSTAERNSCRGAYGAFDISKSARNGKIQQ